LSSYLEKTCYAIVEHYSGKLLDCIGMAETHGSSSFLNKGNSDLKRRGNRQVSVGGSILKRMVINNMKKVTEKIMGK
jgi:hypothetical protein